MILNGAFSTARDAEGLAAALAERGFRAVTYDRRARGGSGDERGSTPVDPAREVEDLRQRAALVAGAVLEIGAVLALFAASRGVPVRHLFLSEPPFHFGEGDPAADLVDRLQSAVDEGRGADAVTLFQREAVGLPDEDIEQIRESPLFDALVPLAQSTVYDATLTRDVSTPTPDMVGIGIPVTILCGEQTFPFLAAAARRLGEAMPTAELVVMPESVMHRLDADAAARVTADRLR